MARKGIFTYVIFTHLKIWQPTQETENAHQSLSYVVFFHLHMFCDWNNAFLTKKILYLVAEWSIQDKNLTRNFE